MCSRSVLAAILALCLLGTLSSSRAEAQGASAMAWGENDSGQLGIGGPTVGPCGCVENPTAVKGLSGATQIVAGFFHALALRSDGTVVGWGENGSGQLGTAEKEQELTQVPGLANVIAIATGEAHTLALRSDGTVAAFGSNQFGQLGTGGTGSLVNPSPTTVPGLSDVVAIAAGDRFSLALRANGTVLAWGADEKGQVGDLGASQGTCHCIAQPTLVPGVSGAVAIAAAEEHAFAVLSDGTVRAWGRDQGGRLGDGTNGEAGCDCRGPISVPGVGGVNLLVAGRFGALARLNSGALEIWSDEDLLPGGEGSGICACILPSGVNGLTAPMGLAAGSQYILALAPNGTIVSWGHNESGQLGDGTREERLALGPVPNLSGVSGVSAGRDASFALIGPSQALEVSLAGAGSGAVGTQGLLCPGACEARYPQSQVVILRAEPHSGSGFAGFSGACTGTAPCQLRMDQDKSLTATFGPPKGTKITRAKINARKHRASFAFSAPGAITGFQCELIRPRGGSGRKRRHRKAHFAACKPGKVYRRLSSGRYTFEVRALDLLGADARPALRHFRIARVRRKR
jgi:hypothetical protein